MPEFDKDLRSIQEARDLSTQAFAAWKIWSHASQEQVDRVCAAMSAAVLAAAERLGTMAHEETGYGFSEHKKLKNEFAARNVWESIKDEKTVGIIHHDPAKRIYDIAWPVGVIAGLTPAPIPLPPLFIKYWSQSRRGMQSSSHPTLLRPNVPTKRPESWPRQPKPTAPLRSDRLHANISLQGTQD